MPIREKTSEDQERQFKEEIKQTLESMARSSLLTFPLGSKRDEVVLLKQFRYTHYGLGRSGYDAEKNDHEHVK